MIRWASGLCLFVCALATGLPAGAMEGDGGVCKLNVTISFTSTGQKMKSLTVAASSPTYSMTVTPQDMDPITAGTTQHCVYNLGGLFPYRSTGVTATPTFMSEDLWTCEAVLATGEWDQGWTPSPPTDRMDLDYIITGTWGSWTLVIQSPDTPPSVVAVVELTFRNPDPDADQIEGPCIDGGNGVTSLALTGWEVFQDP